jgi:DNA-binding NtrC family response regulator
MKVAYWGGAQIMRGGSIFVLTVDDDVAFARAAARSFESVGMRTFLALDPGAPFDGSDAIDVIVTDRAGEPRSLALAQMIKQRGPRGPIILMTAQPDAFRKSESEQQPWQPLEIAELCRMIKVRQAH